MELEPKIPEAIKNANARLKKGKVGVVIYPRGRHLYLQGTFPSKPHVTNKAKPYQQVQAKHLPANLGGVAEAERKAKLIGGQLINGNFDWRDWIEEPEKYESIQNWLTRFESNYWAKRKRTQQSETTWRTDYEVIFNKLPDAPLTIEILIETAIATDPDSRQRKRACEKLANLAKFAGLPCERLVELKGDYSPTAVKPRDLPSDAEIVRVRNLLRDRKRQNKQQSDGWLWIYSAIATYGLRPHEAFRANLNDFPVLRVADETKTGNRFVFPLYPEWAQEWDLQNKALPNLQNLDSLDNATLGNKISGWFQDSKIPFPAYNLRHCYARRCFEFGFSPDFGAKLMGHSSDTHEKVYRAWIDEAVYQRTYDLALSKSDRPHPP